VSPRNGSGPLATRGPATNTIPATATAPVSDQGSKGHRQRRASLVAAGEWFPPAGRRRLGAVIVRACPGCRGMHQHRGLPDDADGVERVGSCGCVYSIALAPVPAAVGVA
jgi:hypothetical protein